MSNSSEDTESATSSSEPLTGRRLTKQQKSMEAMKEEIEVLKSLYPEQVYVVAGMGESWEGVLRVQVTMRVEEAVAAASPAPNAIEIWCTFPANLEDAEFVPEFDVGLSETARPSFERTISGRRFQTKIEVQELPPLHLCVIYGESYPEVAPDFTLSSDWLTASELTVLCVKLDDFSKENEGLPVVCLWIDWLENQAASALGLDGCYNIVPCDDPKKDDSPGDPRAIALTSSVFERMLAIMQNDQIKKMRRFIANTHECPVCLEERRGMDMFLLSGCSHFFCVDCLATYIRTKLNDGAVQSINCPNRGCDGSVPPSTIRQVLGDDDFERFDALALSRALDSMSDVDWCPRCNQAVIVDDSILARCANCFYAFCVKCHDAYHQDTRCPSVVEDLAALAKDEAKPEKGNEKEKMKWRKIRERRLNLLSKTLINQTARPCPTCHVRIVKDQGCNHVICTQCSTHMCWLCGKSVRGYDHFCGDGVTFEVDLYGILRRQIPQSEPPQEYVQMQDRLVDNPQLRLHMVRCPQCRQENLKREDRNNHIRCWSCRTSFCYLCHNRLLPPISAHYAPNRCPQHSDD